MGKEEVQSALSGCEGAVDLMLRLLYGMGMRLMEGGYDIHTMPELPGHSDASTTMVNPLDR